MNELQYIKMEALGIKVGQSKSVYCCFCDNDKPYAPSLSLTRIDEGILYNCFRACCSGHGLIGSLPTQVVTKGEHKEFKPRPYTGTTCTPNYNVLFDTWCIKLEEVRSNLIWGLELEDGGFLFSLFDRTGKHFGHTTKILNAQNKVQHYLTHKTCNLHYAVSKELNNGMVILVEDVISAIRVSRFRQGVALLGTHLNDDKVKDLLEYGARNIIIALDPDALDKAIGLKHKYGIFFDTFRVAVLTADPKDLSHDQLKKELEL